MIRIVTFIICLVFTAHCFAQSGFPKRYEFDQLWKKADSCLTAQNYKKAGDFFYKAASTEVEKGMDFPREDIFYAAAGCYAYVGNKKKTLNVLNKLAFQYQYKNIDIASDSTFLLLHNQKEWKRIIEKIKDNYQISVESERIYAERTHIDNPSDEVIFYPHRSDFTKAILIQDSLPFLSISEGIFRIYFSGKSYAASHISDIKSQINFAFTNSLRILNVEKYNRGTTLIFFDSVEEMIKLTGVRVLGGIAYPEFDSGLFPITAKRRPQFKHEIFHIISLNTWGTSYSRLLVEGGAVYADNECYYENPLPTINSYYLQTNQLVSLDSLIHDFDKIAFKNDVLAYLQSGCVFKYLYEKYGVEKMKLLWIGGFEKFESIYGFSIHQLETDWLDFIKTTPIPIDFDINKLKEGCG
jgi:hypothetical protein